MPEDSDHKPSLLQRLEQLKQALLEADMPEQTRQQLMKELHEVSLCALDEQHEHDWVLMDNMQMKRQEEAKKHKALSELFHRYSSSAGEAQRRAAEAELDAVSQQQPRVIARAIRKYQVAGVFDAHIGSFAAFIRDYNEHFHGIHTNTPMTNAFNAAGVVR